MRPSTFHFLLVLIWSPLAAIAQRDSIDSFVVSQMKQQGIIGLSIGVVKNGKIVMAKGYGQANIELNIPASEKTVYKIASISKQFVAVAIMKLQQQGKLSVSDPITKFIKDAPAKWSSITIRHLLNHTSGLPVEPPGFDGMIEQADSIYIRRAFQDSLTFAPGSKFEYSNFGYFILADIIRVISKRSFSDCMKALVFDQLDLSSTTTTSITTIIPNRAAGYVKMENDVIENAPNYLAMRPSGAFLSNINDLINWEMHMQKYEFLSKKIWYQMWADRIKTPLTMDNEPIYYANGWMVNAVNGKQLFHHGGSLPGFRSVYFRYPSDKTAIIVLSNLESADAYGIAFGVAELLKVSNSQK